MRASEQEQTGGAGVSEVSANLQRIGWGPVPNHEHDLGTDLLVQARDDRGFDRGLIVGVQVKAGPSYFEQPEYTPDGELSGWWYYEPNTEHFDDWVTHCLPHLIVLHDLPTRTSYWAHVTAEAVVSTGRGCKILVPIDQTIDEQHLEQLLTIARQQLSARSMEGTAFAASASSCPPGRLLRYALLAPRLVAPHRNTGHAGAITGEEGLALVLQGRFRDLKLFSENHEDVPDPEDLAAATNWTWRLCAALRHWAFTDNPDELIAATTDAPDEAGRAAAGVLAACALQRQERHEGALNILNGLVESDKLAPADHGWALVQRARVRIELGEVETAQADAVAAQRCFIGDPDDPTVSALAAAAAWQLFTTPGLREGNLGEMISAGDTAVSWWRSQTISWALEQAADEQFRAWSEDRSMRWSTEDLESSNLFAAELSADLTGEHGTWRAIASLAAKRQLIGASSTHNETSELVEGLRALRISGDTAGLKLAVAHLRRVGPLEAVREALHEVPPINYWTHTTAQANLELIALSGDLANTDRATKMSLDSIDLFAGEDQSFTARVRPSFWVEPAALKSLAPLLLAAEPSTHAAAVDALIGAAPIPDRFGSEAKAVIRALDFSALDDDTRAQLRDVGLAQDGNCRAVILGALAEGGDAAAREVIVSRAVGGDLEALSEMGDVTTLPDADAASLIQKFDEMTAGELEAARANSWGFGGFDAPNALALFNLHFPEQARWGNLVDLLSEPSVAADDKRGACLRIAQLSDRLPEEIRTRLVKRIDLVSAATNHGLGSEIGGAGSLLAIAVGAVKGDHVDEMITALAFGTEQEREDAALIIGSGASDRMTPLLAALAVDSQSRVRSATARAVGRLLPNDEGGPIAAIARNLARDAGVSVPSALLSGLSHHLPLAEGSLGHSICKDLRGHLSARVSSMAHQILDAGG